jgi:hypothetical protein
MRLGFLNADALTCRLKRDHGVDAGGTANWGLQFRLDRLGLGGQMALECRLPVGEPNS